MAGIWTDENKFAKMLETEILACEALADKGVMPKEDVKTLREKATFDVERIKEIERTTNHDVVAFIKNVSENVGPASRFLHFGLTSSDVLDTALSAMMTEAADILIERSEKLCSFLREKAIEHKNTPVVGRSHGVHAEPTTMGLKFGLFWMEMKRNVERLKDAKRTIAVGKISGSVGTYANVEPYVEEYVCGKMGLKPARISSQIIQRDRHAFYLNMIAITGATLEKIALEIRGLQKTEIGELQEYFGKGQTGSSSMPHKKNPIICERLCGLARVLRANAHASIENVALWHERDISHSSVERIIVPDSTILLDYMLEKAASLVENLVVNKEKMLKNMDLSGGHIYSQRLLLELIKKGLTRIEAYDMVQATALEAYKENSSFKEKVLSHKKMKELFSEKELEDIFGTAYHMRQVDTVFKNIGLK